jgi:hypothetical protein
LNAGTFNAPVTINESANWSNNGGVFAPGTGTVNFIGTVGQSINGTAAAQTFYNLTANLSAGQTLSTGGSTTTLTARNLTETSGNFTAPATLHVNGNLLLSAGTFTSGANTTVGGNFTNNSNNFIQGGNTVTFNGASAQTIAGSFATTFNNLTISNTGGHVILGIATPVTNQLNFTTGLLDASNFSLTLNSGAPPITGASATGYVITGNGVGTTGVLSINNIPANTTTLFPIGTPTYYLPATINPGANTGNSYSEFVFQGATDNAQANGPAVSAGNLAQIVNAIWNINQTAGSGSATLGLNWASSGTTLEGSAFQTDGTNIGIEQFTGVAWQAATGGGDVATATAASSFGSFSQFLVSTLNFVLPVTISDFNAILHDNNTVVLSWTASNAGNTSDFAVQRTTDGSDWKTIGMVLAKNSDAAGNYSFTDASPARSVNEYRLLIQNVDGTNTYSSIRSVTLSSIAGISVFPNPTADVLNVSVSNAAPDLCIRLISLSGQLLQSVVPGNTGGGGSSIVSMSVRNYAPGIYMLQLISAGRVLQTSGVSVVH